MLGSTLDDAAGEAFDKVAKMLGLGYPGGPAVEAEAAAGDPERVALPAPLPLTLDFSFSGLKTAVRYHLEALGRPPSVKERRDVAAAFQRRVVGSLVEKLFRAAEETHVGAVALAGGVAANQALRRSVAERAAREGLAVSIPPPDLCTDNAAIVAAAGHARLARGELDGLDLDARATLEAAELAGRKRGRGIRGREKQRSRESEKRIPEDGSGRDPSS